MRKAKKAEPENANSYIPNTKIQSYIDEIKLEMTGGLLELELDDVKIQQILNASLRELQPYICSTRLITVPFSECIDLTDYKVNAVTKVFRASAEGKVTDDGHVSVDPLQLSFYQLASGGNMYNFNDYINRYASWNIIQQINNTTSTDMAWYYQDAENKLYINSVLDVGDKVTIEYIPRIETVEEITSDYWINMLLRLAKAKTKIILGRIRGRYTQTNALWTSDAETMLNEGQTEYNALKEYLQANTQLIFPLD